MHTFYRVEYVGGHTHVRARNMAEAHTEGHKCSNGMKLMGVKRVG